MASLNLTIVSSSTILPHRPTPHRTLALSECDQNMMERYVFLFYVYKPPNNNNTCSLIFIDSLRTSLSKILVPYYPLAGRLHWIPGGRIKLHCCGAGTHFIEASAATAKLDDYDDFKSYQNKTIITQLVPSVDYGVPIEEQPVLLVQVTRFGCGGVVIGIAISHFVIDGVGTATFMNSWASIARGESTMDSVVPKPYHERDFLQPRKGLLNKKLPQRFHHQEYQKPQLLLGHSSPEEERNRETIIRSLTLNKSQLQKLKDRANRYNSEREPDPNPNPNPNPNRRPYTTFEVVAGHIWVCACKARKTCTSDQPTVALTTVNIRRRIRPPLPEGFNGNAVLLTVTPICKFGNLMKNPLSYAAGKIREGTSKLTDEYIKSVIDFLASTDNEWIKDLYEKGGCGEGAPFWGNPNIELVCWTSLPFYDADFGWGRPCYIGLASLENLIDGTSYIMPSPVEDGGLIVLICLQTRHMDDFIRFFYEDLCLASL